MKYSAVVLAAGQGTRTGLKHNKILHEINGKKIVDFSLNFFLNDKDCSQIILVIHSKEFSVLKDYQNCSKITMISGGNSRQESVYKSLQFLQEKFVLIHDAARPFLPVKSIKNLKDKLFDYPSVTLGVPVTDTIQRVDGDFAYEILDRTSLIATQTPQGFHTRKLIQAHELAREQKYTGTDDTSLLLKFLDIKSYVIMGDYRNIKFTTQEDLSYLEVIVT